MIENSKTYYLPASKTMLDLLGSLEYAFPKHILVTDMLAVTARGKAIELLESIVSMPEEEPEAEPEFPTPAKVDHLIEALEAEQPAKVAEAEKVAALEVDPEPEAEDEQLEVTTKKCKNCGGMMIEKYRKNAVFCSKDCNADYHHKKGNQKRAQANKAAQAKKSHSPAQQDGECSICGRTAKLSASGVCMNCIVTGARNRALEKYQREGVGPLSASSGVIGGRKLG